MISEDNNSLFSTPLAYFLTLAAYLVSVWLLYSVVAHRATISVGFILAGAATLWVFSTMLLGLVSWLGAGLSKQSRVVSGFFALVLCAAMAAPLHAAGSFIRLPSDTTTWIAALPVIVFLASNYLPPFPRLGVWFQESLLDRADTLSELLWLLWIVGVGTFSVAFYLRFGLADDSIYGLVAMVAVACGFLLRRVYTYLAVDHEAMSQPRRRRVMVQRGGEDSHDDNLAWLSYAPHPIPESYGVYVTYRASDSTGD